MAVHKMYRKFVHLRTFMREEMGHMLQDCVARPVERGFCGVFETLEILGSIVEGFAVPLKEPHVHYLERVLLPLAKTPAFVVFHSPLLYCLLQFTLKVALCFLCHQKLFYVCVPKDPRLASKVAKYMFAHWPVQTARKQVAEHFQNLRTIFNVPRAGACAWVFGASHGAARRAGAGSLSRPAASRKCRKDPPHTTLPGTKQKRD
jgi:hypothetical protein